MKHEIHLAREVGSTLADGGRAVELRMTQFDPYVGLCEKIVLNFDGVRNANSSFVNALVAGAIEQHGTDVLSVIVFKACNPVVRVLIESAITHGVQSASGKSREPACGAAST